MISKMRLTDPSRPSGKILREIVESNSANKCGFYVCAVDPEVLVYVDTDGVATRIFGDTSGSQRSASYQMDNAFVPFYGTITIE